MQSNYIYPAECHQCYFLFHVLEWHLFSIDVKPYSKNFDSKKVWRKPAIEKRQKIFGLPL